MHLFWNFTFVQFVGIFVFKIFWGIVLSCNVLTNLCWLFENLNHMTLMYSVNKNAEKNKVHNWALKNAANSLGTNTNSISWISLVELSIQFTIYLQSAHQVYLSTSWPERYPRISNNKLSLTGAVPREPI